MTDNSDNTHSDSSISDEKVPLEGCQLCTGTGYLLHCEKNTCTRCNGRSNSDSKCNICGGKGYSYVLNRYQCPKHT